MLTYLSIRERHGTPQNCSALETKQLGCLPTNSGHRRKTEAPCPFLSYLELLLCRLCAVLSHFCHIRLFTPPWTVAHQAPLSMGFSRQNYWSGLPCPPPGDLPNPGIKLASVIFPALAGGFLITANTTWESQLLLQSGHLLFSC